MPLPSWLSVRSCKCWSSSSQFVICVGEPTRWVTPCHSRTTAPLSRTIQCSSPGYRTIIVIIKLIMDSLDSSRYNRERASEPLLRDLPAVWGWLERQMVSQGSLVTDISRRILTFHHWHRIARPCRTSIIATTLSLSILGWRTGNIIC